MALLSRWHGRHGALSGASSAAPFDETRNDGAQTTGAAKNLEAREAAFEQFFHAHEATILSYLWRITGDEQASHDIAQETFLRAWQRFEQISHYDQPRAWLFRVATNLASNHRRHRSIHEATLTRIAPFRRPHTTPPLASPNPPPFALGFAQLFHLQGATISVNPSATATAQGTLTPPTPLPTAAPSSPAVSGVPLTWRQANYPAAGITFGNTSSDILSFGVAPTDGTMAYACYSVLNQAGSQITMYRTTDRAMRWARLTHFFLPDVDVDHCLVQVDALDSGRVLMYADGFDKHNARNMELNELTEDSGATWTKLSYSLGDSIGDIATANGRTYAIRENTQGTQGTQGNAQTTMEPRLSVSTDHLRSWQPIDADLVGLGQNLLHVWVGADGKLLALIEMTPTASGTENSLTPTPTQESELTPGTSLWQSDDGGARWNALPSPVLSGNLRIERWVVQQPCSSLSSVVSPGACARQRREVTTKQLPVSSVPSMAGRPGQYGPISVRTLPAPPVHCTFFSSVDS